MRSEKFQVEEDCLQVLDDYRGPLLIGQMSRLTGLSESTLRALDKGGRHKLETIQSLESFLNPEFVPGYGSSADEIYATSGCLADYETLIGPERGGLPFFKALSVTNPTFLKHLELAFQDNLTEYQLRVLSEDGYLKRSETEEWRSLAFENYRLALKDKTSALRFTVDDSLHPLTKGQKQHVQVLSDLIEEYKEFKQKATFSYSQTFKQELEREDGAEIKERIVKKINDLKRVKLNVLVCSGYQLIHVLDEDSEQAWNHKGFERERKLGERVDFTGLSAKQKLSILGKAYVFSYEAPFLHVFLAPESIYRIRCLNLESIEFEPETMFAWKFSDASGTFDHIADLESYPKYLGEES
ncbi:hypothetical protein N9222_01285 [Pseudomonadales bacterium]|nr:hypothetical protein [Pseudomonadales bacterium]